ncbi:hypothetical protein JHK82_012209 [Glycine max]|nr:hypothetical protein JHK82_012209 [Glycine max]
MNTPWHSKSVGRSCKGMSLRVEIGVLGTSKKRPRERGVSTRRERSVVGMEKGEKGVESAQMVEKGEGVNTSIESSHFKTVSLRLRDTFVFYSNSNLYFIYEVTVYSSETAEKSLYFDLENQCFKTYPMPQEIQSKKDYSGWSARFWVDLSPFYDVTFPGVHLDLENFDPDAALSLLFLLPPEICRKPLGRHPHCPTFISILSKTARWNPQKLLSKKSRRKPYTVVGTVGRRKPYTALGTIVGAQSSKLSTLPVNKVLIKLLGHFVHLANHIKVSIRILMWGFILLWKLIVLYVVFKLDESYTLSKVSIRAGDGFQNLKEIKTVELVKPTGWVYLSLSGVDPRTTAKGTEEERESDAKMLRAKSNNCFGFLSQGKYICSLLADLQRMANTALPNLLSSAQLNLLSYSPMTYFDGLVIYKSKGETKDIELVEEEQAQIGADSSSETSNKSENYKEEARNATQKHKPKRVESVNADAEAFGDDWKVQIALCILKLKH